MTHPGIALAEKIKHSGFRQNHIARQLGVSPTSFNEMLKGRRPFPAVLCVLMQARLGYGQTLYRQQCEYEYDKARETLAKAVLPPETLT